MSLSDIGAAAKGAFLRFKLYALAAAGVAVLLLGAHDRRVDYLRARYLDRLNSISIDLTAAGVTPKEKKDPTSEVKQALAERAQYLSERDQARTLVDVQSASINRLHAESVAAEHEADAQRKLVAETVKQRNYWKAQAQQAETRTERLTAEKELAECDAVLTDLYNKGF